jgi:hypothetical protein
MTLNHEQRQKLLQLLDTIEQIAKEPVTPDSLARSHEVTRALRVLAGCEPDDVLEIDDDLAGADITAIENRLRAEIKRSRELFAARH